MKTKIFAILNILSFFGMIIPLELESSTLSHLVLAISAILFVASLLLSVCKPKIWNLAHKNPEHQFSTFYRDNYRILSGVLVSSVVVISIVGDFIKPERDLSLFISRVVIYLSLLMPNFYVIFKQPKVAHAEV
ncbi:MAG: hypothetical protein RLN88_11095 [Ekhidna sp.]|uniref:hypothetical protein n=1 Tax=Ekhidna sp. TaxID=2608089 RepID=UPI0032EDF6B1